MANQPEALRLADFLDDQYDPSHNLEEAAAELRRLHDLLSKANEHDMTPEDILRMAREAGFYTNNGTVFVNGCDIGADMERFAILVAAAEREKLAHWMRSLGYATGQGKTTEDLLDFLGVGIDEGLEAETMAERQRCAQIAREFDREQPNTNYGGYIARLIEETAP
jgi:hypothetical protein